VTTSRVNFPDLTSTRGCRRFQAVRTAPDYLEAARRIAEAVRRDERTGRDMAGETPIKHPTEPEFWALLTGVDLTGLRYTFVRVIPGASVDRADFT
jgi:hypothetical protein